FNNGHLRLKLAGHQGGFIASRATTNYHYLRVGAGNFGIRHVPHCADHARKLRTGLTVACPTSVGAMESQVSFATAPPGEVAHAAAVAIRERTGVQRHEIALVLGSGWSGAADLSGVVGAEIPAGQVPGFAASTVAGQSGLLRSIRLKDSEKQALVIGARTHLYEGLGVRRVVHGVRTAAALGSEVLVLTNGCGGLDTIDSLCTQLHSFVLQFLPAYTSPVWSPNYTTNAI